MVRKLLATLLHLLWLPMWILGAAFALALGAISQFIMWVDRNDWHREAAWALEDGGWWVIRHVALAPAPLRRLAARIAPADSNPAPGGAAE